MRASPREIVYVNGGAIYKAPTDADLGNNYVADDTADSIFSFVKVDGKRYLFTTEFKSYFSGGEGTSLGGIDLCPDVSLWICLGAPTPEERTNFDIFFAIDSSAQLQKVADYYGLPYPITQETADWIDRAPEELMFWCIDGGRPIVPAGIKFIDGKPAIFKCYTYPKPNGRWDVWMYGVSYYDGGKPWESGAIYQTHTGGVEWPNAEMRGKSGFTKAEVIETNRADGVGLRYKFLKHNADPLMFWEGQELAADGTVARVKRYESARWAQIAIAKKKAGFEFEGRDLCPAANYWVGRAYYDDSDEEELFFAAESRDMIVEVAKYYGLPVPYGAEQAAVLDTNPTLYRARHYDLLGLGEGSYIPVVACSVTFVGGNPTRLLLYALMRQWEFEDQIVLPTL